MKQRRNWVVNAPTHITAIIPNNLSSPRCTTKPAHRVIIAAAFPSISWRIKRRLVARVSRRGILSVVKNRRGKGGKRGAPLLSSSLLMGSRAVESRTKRDAGPRERSRPRLCHALFNTESAQFCPLFSDAMLRRSRISRIRESTLASIDIRLFRGLILSQCSCISFKDVCKKKNSDGNERPNCVTFLCSRLILLYKFQS